MTRRTDLQTRFPAHYLNEMFIQARLDRDWTIQDVSRATGIQYASVQRAEAGIASYKIVRRLADFYEIDWLELHSLPRVKRSKTKVQKVALAVSGLGGSLSAG